MSDRPDAAPTPDFIPVSIAASRMLAQFIEDFEQWRLTRVYNAKPLFALADEIFPTQLSNIPGFMVELMDQCEAKHQSPEPADTIIDMFKFWCLARLDRATLERLTRDIESAAAQKEPNP